MEAYPWNHNCFRARSQCLQENPWTTAHCRIAPSGTSSSLIETSSCSPSSAGPRRLHSHGVWSLDMPRPGAMSGHQSWAACSMLKSRKGDDKNSELKQRLQLWELGQVSVLIGKVLGQQNSGARRRTTGRTQPQTDEQCGRRACALTARGTISKAMKGLVVGAAHGSADCRRNWTTALIPRSSGIGTHPTNAECVEAARFAWSGWRYQRGDEGARTQQNMHSIPASRQAVSNECSWSCW